ncbi:MAG: hydroxysqualene dehydroxylase HpnE [bacterium]|nr:hydroxysqualene dehydroxylase HpnE [bacterium]
MTRHVVIVGGGFAGLAAGVALAERGLGVTVLEARQRLGGRAYSFRDAATGETVDNGQHAMMGCYTRTLGFLRRIGAAGKLVRQENLRVDLVHPTEGKGSIACPGWPSPLHMLAGITRYRLLSRGERLRALLGGLRLLARHRRRDAALAAATVDELLVGLGQSAHARAAFWTPVVLATLNESPERAAAGPFAEVLARAFFRSRADSQFVLPRVGLSDLYTDDARRHIEAHGGRVESGAPAAALETDGTRLSAVVLRDGRRLAADACISTVTPRALGPLLPPALRAAPALDGLDAFETSPIVSAHCWLDRPVLDGDFVGLLGTTTQWAFNRTRLTGETAGGGQCVSAVISAGREVVGWETSRVAERVLADLRAVLPAARAAALRHAVVVKEKHATTSLTPATERRRPGPVTPLGGFFLAGDWTATGLPATIESAVESGERAAELVAAQWGAC